MGSCCSLEIKKGYTKLEGSGATKKEALENLFLECELNNYPQPKLIPNTTNQYYTGCSQICSYCCIYKTKYDKVYYVHIKGRNGKYIAVSSYKTLD